MYENVCRKELVNAVIIQIVDVYRNSDSAFYIFYK